MKKLLVLTILLICSVLANAESPSHMVVKCIDGSQITYTISDEPMITFDGINMVISTKGVNVEHALNCIEHIYYEKEHEASLNNEYVDATPYYIQDNILSVVNNVSDLTISIYDTNGICIINKSFHHTEKAIIPLDNLNKGLHILTINKNSFKIHIR